MFEKNVDKFILEDALKLSLLDYLKQNGKEVKVKKWLKGKRGQCIKNSITYDKKQVAIGFCVFNGKDMINTLDIIIHAVNYNDEGKLIDNTKLRKYTFYEVERFDVYDELTEEGLRENMCRIIDDYKERAINNFTHIYKDIKNGNFKFREDE